MQRRYYAEKRELRYRKIRKISPGAYIFPAKALFEFPASRGLSRRGKLFEGLIFGGGLYWEGLIYGGKFAFQNRLG